MRGKAWVIFCVTIMMVATLLAIGCGPSPPPPTDHLLLTMSFDDDPEGYYQGEQANVYFLDGHRFRLTDIYGTFEGDYKWQPDKNKLTLDFDDYPTWYMTLDPEGTFSGSEAGYDNGGTHEWL